MNRRWKLKNPLWKHCNQNCILPYECEFACVSWGYIVIKQKHQLSEISRQKLNFIDRINYAKHKTFCICVEVYKFFEGNDYDKIYEILSKLKKNIKN